MTQHDTSLASPAEPMPMRNVRERLEPLQVTIAEAARLLAYDTRTIRRLMTLRVGA